MLYFVPLIKQQKTVKITTVVLKLEPEKEKESQTKSIFGQILENLRKFHTDRSPHILHSPSPHTASANIYNLQVKTGGHCLYNL